MKTRMGALAGLVALTLVAVAGCSNPFASCEEERDVVEVVYGSWGYEFQRLSLEFHQQNGWDCRSDGEIRNAWGATIGTRYVCTRCKGD